MRFSVIANNSSFASAVVIAATRSNSCTCTSIFACNSLSFLSSIAILSANCAFFTSICFSLLVNVSSRKFRLSSLRNSLFSISVTSCFLSLISFSAAIFNSCACVRPSNTACFTIESAFDSASLSIRLAFC